MSIQPSADRTDRTEVADTRQSAGGLDPTADRRAAGVRWRCDQLADALETGGDELDPDAAQQAAQVVAKVRERAALLGPRTVVALAGATGSGKSSLFNLLAGAAVATVGARRPTTSVASAAIWGEAPVTELADWLEVPARYEVDGAGRPDPLDGLVLLDLPDMDSHDLAHHLEADRLLERVDVLVWVTDPQKYADARLHDDYLRALSHHQAVLLVVLNQVDRLPEDQVERVREDVRRLLGEDGIGDVPVLTSSARTAEGVDALRERLADLVQRRAAAQQRLEGDLARAALRVREGVADAEPRGLQAPDELVAALARAAGVPVVVAAVRRDHRRRALARTGWPFVRWARGLRPDPLRRLRLGGEESDSEDGASSGVSAVDVRRVVGRSSLPAPSSSARAGVDLAVRASADLASAGLPDRWAVAVDRAVRPDERSLADALDRAVTSTRLRDDPPLWWTPVSVLQRLLALTAVVGAAWLLVLVVVGWLQLPNEAPTVGVIPVPLLLLLGGLLLGLLLGAVSRSCAWVGARRRARAVQERLHQAIRGVAGERVDRPIETVLARHRQVRHQLDGAASG